jgi:hypothetical protein
MIFSLKQLLPLTYRTHYWDTGHQLHFCVWQQWFGHCFNVDDVVMKYDAGMEQRCKEAFERGEYRMLSDVIDELRKQVEASA